MSAALPGAPVWALLKESCGARCCRNAGFSSFCLLRLSSGRIQMAFNVHTHLSGIDGNDVMFGNLNITKIYL